jgi:2-polyprenyl-6-hydroxyphenyl methylase/3-demethylubiquinone-9 3-methyltransferase
MENIDIMKIEPNKYAKLKYKLKNANVFVSKGGYYFIDYLDPVENLDAVIDGSALNEKKRQNIETNLEHNKQKFLNQANLVRKYIETDKANILDIGCGGGRFLSLLKGEVSDAIGIELCDSRAEYARIFHDLCIVKRPIEDKFWEKNYSSYFDGVTLWDVIEHVNYPHQTLRKAYDVLKTKGYLMLDTPCRDGFYHRFGEIFYNLSFGRFPTFLNIMYSDHLFGHKQIFSIQNMKDLFEDIGLKVIELRLISELSFPYEYYVKRLFRTNFMSGLAIPVVSKFLSICKLKSKMIAVGQKR